MMHPVTTVLFAYVNGGTFDNYRTVAYTLCRVLSFQAMMNNYTIEKIEKGLDFTFHFLSTCITVTPSYALQLYYIDKRWYYRAIEYVIEFNKFLCSLLRAQKYELIYTIVTICDPTNPIMYISTPNEKIKIENLTTKTTERKTYKPLLSKIITGETHAKRRKTIE